MLDHKMNQDVTELTATETYSTLQTAQAPTTRLRAKVAGDSNANVSMVAC